MVVCSPISTPSPPKRCGRICQKKTTEHRGDVFLLQVTLRSTRLRNKSALSAVFAGCSAAIVATSAVPKLKAWSLQLVPLVVWLFAELPSFWTLSKVVLKPLTPEGFGKTDAARLLPSDKNMGWLSFGDATCIWLVVWLISIHHIGVSNMRML